MRAVIVDGLEFAGIFAADGSLNIIEAPNPITQFIGSMHPSGALYVTITSGEDRTGLFASDGSLNATEAEGDDFYHSSGSLQIQLIEG